MKTKYWVPWPPSVNSMWRSWNNRTILSKRGREWYTEALDRLEAQGVDKLHFPASISLRLRPPTKRKYDIDNRAKPVLDVMVKAGILEDDNFLYVVELHIIHEEVDKHAPGVWVDIEKVV